MNTIIESIAEQNKLIAIFMGAKYNERVDLMWYEGIPHMVGPLDTKFHESWDWLMPVIKKIDNLEEMYGNREYIDRCDIIDSTVTCDYNISDVYPLVVDFIKFYNKHAQQN
jgi:hypothetical protein